jgi:hypothetical protein
MPVLKKNMDNQPRTDTFIPSKAIKPEKKKLNMTNWKMTYTKLDGSRNTVTFTDKAKLDAALSKAKTANPNHDMAEVVESYDPFADVKPVSWKERASVRGEAAYNHRVRGY